jgi:hypothetical protein
MTSRISLELFGSKVIKDSKDRQLTSLTSLTSP